jgi:arabinofuranosyltransferase
VARFHPAVVTSRNRADAYAAPARPFIVTVIVLLVCLVRTAWLSDDAYITFRTADNFLHGYGLVWNVGERVQTYTHPLWLALLTPAVAVTREVYFTSLALGAVCTLAAVLLIVRLSTTRWNAIVCMAALVSSKAFIDFSTSGLENPLTHVLLLVFLWVWWDEPDGVRRLRRLCFIAALCLLTRLDLAPLVAPALAVEVWRVGFGAAMQPAIVGFLPLIAWEFFSTFYYGTPLPNTAYAKLNTVMSADVRLRHGYTYLTRAATGDPATLPVIAATVTALYRGRRQWPIVAGVALYLAYVVQEGGDWMMGRFLTPAFIVGIGTLARASWLQSRRTAFGVGGAVVVLGLLATWEPAIFSGYGYSYAKTRRRPSRTASWTSAATITRRRACSRCSAVVNRVRITNGRSKACACDRAVSALWCGATSDCSAILPDRGCT